MSLLSIVVATGGPPLIERLREFSVVLGRSPDQDPTELLRSDFLGNLPEEIQVPHPFGYGTIPRLVRAELRLLKGSYITELKLSLRDGWYLASGISTGGNKHVVIPQECWSVHAALDVDKATVKLEDGSYYSALIVARATGEKAAGSTPSSGRPADKTRPFMKLYQKIELEEGKSMPPTTATARHLIDLLKPELPKSAIPTERGLIKAISTYLKNKPVDNFLGN